MNKHISYCTNVILKDGTHRGMLKVTLTPNDTSQLKLAFQKHFLSCELKTFFGNCCKPSEKEEEHLCLLMILPKITFK